MLVGLHSDALPVAIQIAPHRLVPFIPYCRRSEVIRGSSAMTSLTIRSGLSSTDKEIRTWKA